MIRAIAATALALGFAGSALAHDRDHWDRHDRDRHEWRHDYRDRGDRGWRHDERPRYYATPRYEYRYRAPAPRGWYPGWREPYGRGYRYWNDSYYYFVPSAPSFGVSFTLPLR
jgi:hypothetical protein